MKPRTLRGHSAGEVKAWVSWYLGKLGASSLSSEEVIRAALREEGNGANVTKTRVRKAIKRLLPRNQEQAEQVRRNA
jgi:hypothetical protein